MLTKHDWIKKALIVLIYMTVWEAASLLVGSELLLPSPFSTIQRFFELIVVAESWKFAGLTLLRIMGGYVLGALAGILFAIATARSDFMENLLSPLRGVIKATPIMSFILLAVLWLNSNLVPLFIAVLIVLPTVWTVTADAILHTDVRLIEMGQTFGLTKAKIIWKIYVPSVLPQFLAACTTSLGFAWKSGVAAEVIALPKQSIGYQLYESKLRIETVDLFAWTLLVIILSMLLERLLIQSMRRIRRD